MPVKPNKHLSQLLKKIPIFDGLSPTQIQKVLSICNHKSCEIDEVICSKNAASDEMHILLTGRLVIKKPDGTLIVTISPVTTVGEMGIITRQPRSVTIEAMEPSSLLVIQKSHFDQLLHGDLDIALKIYRNIIVVLSSRFLKENVRRTDYQRQKAYIVTLEQKLEIAMDLLDEKGMPRAETQRTVAEKLKERIPQIMIVDDEAVIRRSVKRALPIFEVIEAENGKAALQIIQQSTPSLVITDINMPEMDGLTLLAELRSECPDLPVLGLSGYVDAEKALNFGFDGFLEKPLRLESLMEQIQMNLNKTH